MVLFIYELVSLVFYDYIIFSIYIIIIITIIYMVRNIKKFIFFFLSIISVFIRLITFEKLSITFIFISAGNIIITDIKTVIRNNNKFLF